jgi:hypothetical protein
VGVQRPATHARRTGHDDQVEHSTGGLGVAVDELVASLLEVIGAHASANVRGRGIFLRSRHRHFAGGSRRRRPIFALF